MPKKDHRTVKMSRPAGDKPVSVWVALSGVIAATLASSTALLSGGLGAGTIGLFVAGPVFIWLIWGRRTIFGSALASLVGVCGLAVMQHNGWLPPSVLDPGSVLVAVSVGLPILYGVSLLWRLRSQAHKPHSSIRPDALVLPARHAATGHQSVPWLIVEISPLDRIRRLEGAIDLVAGAEVGSVAGLVLRDQAGLELTAGSATAINGEEIFVIETSSVDGRSLLIVRSANLDLDQSGTAEQKLRDRTNFFASLGHDLKSPLNAVIGFAEMMETEIRGPMPEAYKDYPGLIRESGQTLLRLVDDMLGFARSEAGTYEIDPVPMDIVASGEAVMRQSMPEAERAGVTLKMTAMHEIIANADAGAVQRIWDNLVSNAIKYSPKGGVVTLAGKQRGNDVQLSVTDQGIGMDAEDLARIATPFEQGRNSRGRAGTGLGLAMVQRLAEMHGGRVIIRTAPGEGAHVTVTLPAAIDRTQEAAE